MADLNLRPDLVQRLEEIARRENRPVDDLIEALLTRYEPSPASGLAEQDVVLRADRLRTYQRARRYWQGVGDDRQHLTDDQLDQEFWLFDQNGIPRLKSDQGIFEYSRSPFELVLDQIEHEAITQPGELHHQSEQQI